MDSQNVRGFEFVTRTPLWAILPERFINLAHAIVAGCFKADGWEAAKPYALGKPKSRMAVIPVQGVLTKDGPSSWGSSYDGITDAAEAAEQDPNVKHIVLAVNSPGGEVTGLPEAAAVLARVAKSKPMTAVVDGMAASAAYWLASQAKDIHLTPSGEVGSVGVRMMHVDISKMLGDAGFKVTELYSGDFKTEWSPFKPLSDDAIGSMQTRLTAAHTQFIQAVDGGRGVRAATARDKRFGEGRMFDAPEAYGMGLVDKILSPRESYKALMPPQEEPGAPIFDMPRAKRVEIEKGRF